MIRDDMMNIDNQQMLLRAATHEQGPQKQIRGKIKSGGGLPIEDAPAFLLAWPGRQVV